MKNKNWKLFYIKIYKTKILVFLFKKLFLSQEFLKAPINISQRTYTFLYVTKMLSNFGLIAPVNRKFGF